VLAGRDDAELPIAPQESRFCGVIRFADSRGCGQRTHSPITADARSHLVRLAGQRSSALKSVSGNCRNLPSPHTGDRPDGALLEPEERSHNETMAEHDDGLIRVSQAQCLFKPANPLDEIGKALAARAPQGVTPLPIGRGSAV
jgi:hypothetical protein